LHGGSLRKLAISLSLFLILTTGEFDDLPKEKIILHEICAK
jgi:hypothetical protein